MSESQLEPHVVDILHKIAKREGIHNLSILSTVGSSKGDGYVGQVNSLQLKGSNKTLYVIIKYASTDLNFRKQLPIKESFTSEIRFYDKVAPCFEELRKNAGVIFDTIPKCYWTCDDAFQELIVLEDLKKNGYVLCDRLIPRDQKEVELVLTEYGKLHAFSFALKDQKPEEFSELAKSLGDNMKCWFTKGRMITTCIALSQQARMRIKDKTQLERYVKVYDGMRSFLMDYDYTTDKFAAITHADCWSNNMMFKYQVINGGRKEPQHVKLIDYQLSRCGSIIFDVCHFLSVCTDYKIWNNLDYYLEIYYNSLSNFTKQLGSNLPKFLTFDAFKEEFRKKCKYGMLLSLLYLKAVLFETNEVPDLRDLTEENLCMEGFLHNIKRQDIYIERCQFLIDYFYKNNFY